MQKPVPYGATDDMNNKPLVEKEKSRSLSDWIARIAFLFFFVLATLPAWIYAAIGDALWACLGCFCCWWSAWPEWQRCRGRLLAWMLSSAWRCAFVFSSCWLRVESSGTAPLKGAGRAGRPVFAVSNHASFLDFPVICAYLPWNLTGDMKTLMASGHLRLPLLGRLAHAVGHMPVPFRNSHTRGDFSVDKEKMAEIMERVDAHVASGGHIGLFPEGDLNKDWKTLKRFRAGGLEIAIRHDMEVWGWVIAGTADSWPVGEMLGGSPARVTMSAELLYSSASEAGKRLAGPDSDLRAQAEAMAEDMRATMQRMMDSLVEDGCRGESVA
mmetsp:Transcript_124993/g.266800  ORF Transcript_124993/g.266800 Transcript_124993/m.266800 type:complete len:326 (-) Transcript_124993:101-1078(-)